MSDEGRCVSLNPPQTAVQRRLCHRTHQRLTHPGPASAGARYLIHLIQCAVGKIARCSATHTLTPGWGVGLFSAGVMNVSSPEQLWGSFTFCRLCHNLDLRQFWMADPVIHRALCLLCWLKGSAAFAQQPDHPPWRQRQQHSPDDRGRSQAGRLWYWSVNRVSVSDLPPLVFFCFFCLTSEMLCWTF